MKPPKEYIELIDTKYNEAKKEGIPRVDVKWGVWSAEMNRETRKYTKEHPREELTEYYNLVFGYWVVTSQLLDLHYQRKVHHIYKRALIKRKSKERKELRDIIINKKLEKFPFNKLDALGIPKL